LALYLSQIIPDNPEEATMQVLKELSIKLGSTHVDLKK
jgi:hypothetical protein